jgi:hypothetical protein
MSGGGDDEETLKFHMSSRASKPPTVGIREEPDVHVAGRKCTCSKHGMTAWMYGCKVQLVPLAPYACTMLNMLVPT